MPAAYSTDMRGGVTASVESGSSRREAAEEFDVSPSYGDQMGCDLRNDWKLGGGAAGRERLSHWRSTRTFC